MPEILSMKPPVRKFGTVQSSAEQGAGTDVTGMRPTPLSPEHQQESNMTPDKVDTNHITDDKTAAEDAHVSEDVIEGYREFLSGYGIGDAEIFGALDALITTGDVYWSFKLLDRIDIVFHIRPNWVNEKLVTQLEESAPKLYARFAHLVGMHNLAGSLVKYNDTDLQAKAPEEFSKTYDFVNSLSFVLQNQLVKNLAVFDRLVAVATSEWAVKNFTPPQSDE